MCRIHQTLDVYALKGLIKYTNVPSLVAPAQNFRNSEAGLQSRRILSGYSSDSDSGLRKSTPTPTPTQLRLLPSHRHPSQIINAPSPIYLLLLVIQTILEAGTAIQRLHVDVSIMFSASQVLSLATWSWNDRLKKPKTEHSVKEHDFFTIKNHFSSEMIFGKAHIAPALLCYGFCCFLNKLKFADMESFTFG